MRPIGLNCSDCSHSLLSDSWKAFAANLCKEFDLCNGRLFIACCNIECEEDVCYATGDFK